jgi:hypothetical protein
VVVFMVQLEDDQIQKRGEGGSFGFLIPQYHKKGLCCLLLQFNHQLLYTNTVS